MTVIRPNSVSGITSITAQANEINVFRSNGTLAGLNLNGVNFNTTAGISTLAALDVGSNIKLGNAGVITATSYRGDGSQLTGISAGVSLANGVDNRVITASSASALNGESNLTFNGSILALTGSQTISGDLDVAEDIRHIGDTDTRLRFETDTIIARTAANERLRIDSSGRMMIGTTSPSSNAAAYMLTVADPNNSLGNSGITIRAATGVSGGTHQGSIFYSNATSGSGEFAGYLQYNHNDNWFRIGTNSTERVRITSSGYIHAGNLGHGTNKVGGISITGQDYDPYFKMYASTANHWLMQLRSDSTSGNGIFLRSGNSSSTYTLYATGYDENNAHLVVRGDGKIGIGGETNPITTLSINRGDTGANTTFLNAELIRIDGYGSTNSKSGIGFGRYNSGQNGSIPAAFIGAQTGTWSSSTNCHLIFATRDSTGNVEPTERLRISSDGTTRLAQSCDLYGTTGNSQIVGLLGSKTTGGTTNWNDATNARSGNGYTLLLGSHSNGPGGNYYFHVISLSIHREMVVVI